MQFTPYLNFDGNCAEAIAFYARLFGGRIVHQSTFGDLPPQPGMPPLPDAAKERILHALLDIGGQTLMASDAMPSAASDTCGGAYRKPQGLWVAVGVDSPTEGRRIFDALAQGGEVTMPFAPTFFSTGFGMVSDRFGTPWMVNVSESTPT